MTEIRRSCHIKNAEKQGKKEEKTHAFLMWQNQRLPKLERSASASIAYGNLTEIFDRANVAVQREVDSYTDEKFL